MLKGKSALKSPVPVERAVQAAGTRAPEAAAARPGNSPGRAPVEPPPPWPSPIRFRRSSRPSSAPRPSRRTRPGVLTPNSPAANSQGPGERCGSGTGRGTGIGEGSGPGIGDGTGGGTGGGPYRPGSGITAPSILQEVKPDYTEEARRRSLSGDVVLEIVVRAMAVSVPSASCRVSAPGSISARSKPSASGDSRRLAGSARQSTCLSKWPSSSGNCR